MRSLMLQSDRHDAARRQLMLRMASLEQRLPGNRASYLQSLTPPESGLSSSRRRQQADGGYIKKKYSLRAAAPGQQVRVDVDGTAPRSSSSSQLLCPSVTDE